MRASLLVTLFLLLHCCAFTQTEAIAVTDMLKIKNIGSVQLSPDGKWVVCSVTSIEPEDGKWEYKYLTQLWLVPADGSAAPRPLTTAKEGASQPVWHPDGQKIAFVRVAEGKPQVFLLSLAGGEPVQLTRFKYGAGNPRFSNDGKQVLFTASLSLNELMNDTGLNPGGAVPEWDTEKPGFAQNSWMKNKAVPDPDGTIEQVRAYLEANEKDRKAKVITKLNFQEESTTSGALSFSHIFLTDAVPGAIPKALTQGFHSYSNPQWVNNAPFIIAEADISTTEHPDRTLETQIVSIDKNSGAVRMLLGKKGLSYNSASVSPSGKWLAYQQGTTSFVSVPQLYIMPLSGTEKDALSIPYDRNKGGLAWADDESAIYFTAQSNGGALLNKAELATRKVTSLNTSEEGAGSFSLKGNTLVYVKTEVANPFELYSHNTSTGKSERISDFNYSWVKQKQLSYPEKFTFKNEKGLTVEYWVMKPAGVKAGQKYPVVLEIHGGPSAMWGPGESSMWHEFQFWCSKGYGVVYANPRGSGGYGYDFLRANVNDWGNGPMSDVLTALGKATSTAAWADTSRLVVTGGSYAGYLIGYIIGHDKRFKAACSQRGVYDLRTFFGEGNAWRLVPNYFGGYPWEKAVLPILERESPINYVQNITTPYIMFHGENDLRTGVIQSEQMYRSLKVLGRPVEYVRHPGATHEITRSGNNRQRIDQMLRTWEFFERFVR